MVKVFETNKEPNNWIAHNDYTIAADEVSAIEIVETFNKELKVDVALEVQLRQRLPAPIANKSNTFPLVVMVTVVNGTLTTGVL